MDLIDYLHEFHPYDWLFVVPITVSALLFWKHQGSHFSLFETAVGSAVAATMVTLAIMSLMFGVWSLIGITAGLILAIYLPICAIVGLITSQVLKRA